MNLKISLTSAEPFSSVKQYQQRWEIVTALANSVQFGLKHSELFLYLNRWRVNVQEWLRSTCGVGGGVGVKNNPVQKL